MKEPKVVFCNAPWYDLNNKWYGIRAGSRWPFIIESPKLPENTIGGYNTYPFFMGYAVNYLTFIAGLKEVYFYDALALKHTYATFYGEIDKIKPDIVILETSTPSIENDLEIARNIKERGSEVALCGSHATVFAEELIKLPYIDYILQGEYEINSFEMCLMRKKGIYFCKPLVNIDRLSPARYAPYIYNYADGFGQDKYIEYPQLQMWTSRGCPYGCSFCLWRHTMTNGYYRTRNVDMVIRELTSCMKNFQFRSVLFDDDTLILAINEP